MSSCSSNGRQKVKHSNKTMARLHAHKLNKKQLHKSHAYYCNKCNYWHVGRIPKSQEYAKLLRYEQSIDERLVGKLIGALKNVINGVEE